MSPLILIALGANLPGPFGGPQETMQQALRALATKGVRTIKLSRFWLSEPVPASNDPWFTNAVAQIETDLNPYDLLMMLKATERVFGRQDTDKNAPRPLDIDIIAYQDKVIKDGELIVPHPRMQERLFVLCPLDEVAPGWCHPISKKTVREMMAAFPAGQILRPQEAAA